MHARLRLESFNAAATASPRAQDAADAAKDKLMDCVVMLPDLGAWGGRVCSPGWTGSLGMLFVRGLLALLDDAAIRTAKQAACGKAAGM